MKKRFSEEQIIGFLRKADAGMAVKNLCRRHGFIEASYCLWRSKFGGISVPDVYPLNEFLVLPVVAAPTSFECRFFGAR